MSDPLPPKKTSVITYLTEHIGLFVGLFLLIAFSLWCFGGVALFSIAKYADIAQEKLPERGQFGDMFGAANSLLAILTIAGLAATFVLQRKQIEQQKEELRLQQQAWKDEREENIRTEQRQRCFDLFMLWASDEFQRVLHNARLSRDNYNYKNTWQQRGGFFLEGIITGTGVPKHRDNVARVIEFLRNVSVLVDQKILLTEDVQAVFGHVFHEWFQLITQFRKTEEEMRTPDMPEQSKVTLGIYLTREGEFREYLRGVIIPLMQKLKIEPIPMAE